MTEPTATPDGTTTTPDPAPTEVATAPVVESPPAEEAPVENAAVEAPAVEEAPVEVPAAEAPAVEEAAAEETAAETPAVEEAPVEAPAAAAPAVEQAAAEETAAETPAADPVPADAPASETAAPETTAPDTAAPETAAPDVTAADAPASTDRRAPAKPGAPGGRSRPGKPSRPGRPGAPGGRPAGGGAAVAEPLVTATDPHEWGRIDADGVVFVRTADGERQVGIWQAGDAEAGLAHYGRRFDDFSTEIAVLESRLASGSGEPKATRQQALQLREQVAELAAVGDLDSAAARLEVVIGAAEQAVAGASQARSEARTRSIAAKEALCVEAEELSTSTQWKAAGDRFKTIVDDWRTITGIDRKTDDALWKRFAKARDTFSRHRGAHFAELDKQRGAAKAVKEALIKRAEELSSSTEWGDTAASYRSLMDDWKAAGRAPREVEEALWGRFRAAQEAFFARRNQVFSERDAEFEGNAAIKEQLLQESASIDPVADLDAAKAKLRSIQERWEAAGKVPRERIRELDGKLKVIEDKVRSAEEAHWRRTDPETQARVAQFRDRVEQYRAQAEKARAAGNARKAKEADAQAEQWQQWLAAAENAVEG